MSRPDLSRLPEYFHQYTNQVVEDDLMLAFRNQLPVLLQFFRDLPVEKRGHRYGPDKWTIQEVLQHLIDAERVFAYRAMCIARKETVSLPSFDENAYADNSKAAARNWDDMIEEFTVLRQSTERMFGSFDEEQLDTTGAASGRSVYVLGIGFIAIGHVNHHLRIFNERYL